MRKTIFASTLAATTLAVWPAAPAMATHDPCIPSDRLCIQIRCSDPTRGAWYIYIDSRGLPHWDFTDCASA